MMKFHYFLIISLFLLLTSSIAQSQNSSLHQTDHMIPSQKTAVLTSSIDINVSPSYNTSYGEPAPILQTQNKWSNIIYGILFIIVGLVEVFYGYRLIRITLLVMGFLFWSSTSLVVLLFIDVSFETSRSFIFYFLIWLGFGLLGGLLSYWCWHLGLILTAAYGGYAFIITLLTLVQISIDILRYFIISFFVLLPTILVYKFERISVNVATSIAGSYTFFYGVDEFAHQGYREMIQLTRSEGTLRFRPTIAVYIMIIFTVLLAASGIAFEHFYHKVPCNNPWCGDKHRNQSEKENTSEVQQNSNFNFCNPLLAKIKLRLSNLQKKNNKNIANQIDDNKQHAINIDN